MTELTAEMIERERAALRASPPIGTHVLVPVAAWGAALETAAEAQRLREALRPFAAEAEKWRDDASDRKALFISDRWNHERSATDHGLTIGHLRAARAALQEPRHD